VLTFRGRISELFVRSCGSCQDHCYDSNINRKLSKLTELFTHDTTTVLYTQMIDNVRSAECKDQGSSESKDSHHGYMEGETELSSEV
jgi:hypothetical protein